MTVIDPLPFSVLKRIYTGANAASIKFDSRTNLLYLGKKHDDTVEVFDPFSSMAVGLRACGRGNIPIWQSTTRAITSIY